MASKKTGTKIKVKSSTKKPKPVKPASDGGDHPKKPGQ
jgi:hypothetical protein